MSRLLSPYIGTGLLDEKLEAVGKATNEKKAEFTGQELLMDLKQFRETYPNASLDEEFNFLDQQASLNKNLAEDFYTVGETFFGDRMPSMAATGVGIGANLLGQKAFADEMFQYANQQDQERAESRQSFSAAALASYESRERLREIQREKLDAAGITGAQRFFAEAAGSAAAALANPRGAALDAAESAGDWVMMGGIGRGIGVATKGLTGASRKKASENVMSAREKMVKAKDDLQLAQANLVGKTKDTDAYKMFKTQEKALEPVVKNSTKEFKSALKQNAKMQNKPNRYAEIGATAYVGAAEGTGSASQTYQAIAGMDLDELSKTQAYKQYKAENPELTPEEIRRDLALNQATKAGTLTGVAAAAIGKLSGVPKALATNKSALGKPSAAQRIADEFMGKKTKNIPEPKGVIGKTAAFLGGKNTLKMAGTEAVEEAFQGTAGHVISNKMVGDIDEKTKPMDQAGEVFGESAVIGGMAGGGMNAARAATEKTLSKGVTTAEKIWDKVKSNTDVKTTPGYARESTHDKKRKRKGYFNHQAGYYKASIDEINHSTGSEEEKYASIMGLAELLHARHNDPSETERMSKKEYDEAFKILDPEIKGVAEKFNTRGKTTAEEYKAEYNTYMQDKAARDAAANSTDPQVDTETQSGSDNTTEQTSHSDGDAATNSTQQAFSDSKYFTNTKEAKEASQSSLATILAYALTEEGIKDKDLHVALSASPHTSARHKKMLANLQKVVANDPSIYKAFVSPKTAGQVASEKHRGGDDPYFIGGFEYIQLISNAIHGDDVQSAAYLVGRLLNFQNSQNTKETTRHSSTNKANELSPTALKMLKEENKILNALAPVLVESALQKFGDDLKLDDNMDGLTAEYKAMVEEQLNRTFNMSDGRRTKRRAVNETTRSNIVDTVLDMAFNDKVTSAPGHMTDTEFLTWQQDLAHEVDANDGVSQLISSENLERYRTLRAAVLGKKDKATRGLGVLSESEQQEYQYLRDAFYDAFLRNADINNQDPKALLDKLKSFTDVNDTANISKLDILFKDAIPKNIDELAEKRKKTYEWKWVSLAQLEDGDKITNAHRNAHKERYAKTLEAIQDNEIAISEHDQRKFDAIPDMSKTETLTVLNYNNLVILMTKYKIKWFKGAPRASQYGLTSDNNVMDGYIRLSLSGKIRTWLKTKINEKHKGVIYTEEDFFRILMEGDDSKIEEHRAVYHFLVDDLTEHNPDMARNIDSLRKVFRYVDKALDNLPTDAELSGRRKKGKPEFDEKNNHFREFFEKSSEAEDGSPKQTIADEIKLHFALSIMDYVGQHLVLAENNNDEQIRILMGGKAGDTDWVTPLAKEAFKSGVTAQLAGDAIGLAFMKNAGLTTTSIAAESYYKQMIASISANAIHVLTNPPEGTDAFALKRYVVRGKSGEILWYTEPGVSYLAKKNSKGEQLFDHKFHTAVPLLVAAKSGVIGKESEFSTKVKGCVRIVKDTSFAEEFLGMTKKEAIHYFDPKEMYMQDEEWMPEEGKMAVWIKSQQAFRVDKGVLSLSEILVEVYEETDDLSLHNGMLFASETPYADPDKVHKDRRNEQVQANKDSKTWVENTIQFVRDMQLERHNRVWFRNRLNRANLRFHSEGANSPMSNKLGRELLKLERDQFEVQVLSGTNHSMTKMIPQYMFQASVLEALGLETLSGRDVDKASLDVITQTWDEFIANDGKSNHLSDQAPHMFNASKAMAEVLKFEALRSPTQAQEDQHRKDRDELKKELVLAVKGVNGSAHILSAITGLAAYHNRDSDGKFWTTVTKENDSITSGIAITLGQLANVDTWDEFVKALEKVGVFVSGDQDAPIIDFGTRKETPDSNGAEFQDSYEAWAKTYNGVIKREWIDATSENGFVPSEQAKSNPDLMAQEEYAFSAQNAFSDTSVVPQVTVKGINPETGFTRDQLDTMAYDHIVHAEEFNEDGTDKNGNKRIARVKMHKASYSGGKPSYTVSMSRQEYELSRASTSYFLSAKVYNSQGQLTTLQNLLDAEIDRKFAKQPLMLFNYAAGLKSLKESVVNAIMQGMYAKLEEINQIDDSVERGLAMEAFTEYANSLSPFTNGKLEYGGKRDKERRAAQKAIGGAYKGTYPDSVGKTDADKKKFKESQKKKIALTEADRQEIANKNKQFSMKNDPILGVDVSFLIDDVRRAVSFTHGPAMESTFERLYGTYKSPIKRFLSGIALLINAYSVRYDRGKAQTMRDRAPKYKAENKENIWTNTDEEKLLKDIEPYLPAVMSSLSDEKNPHTWLNLMNHERTKDIKEENEYGVAKGTPLNPDTDEVKAVFHGEKENEWTSQGAVTHSVGIKAPGVGAFAKIIQSVDSAHIILATIENMNTDAANNLKADIRAGKKPDPDDLENVTNDFLGIHDAVVAGGDSIIPVTKSLNKAFITISFYRNKIFTSLVKSLEKTLTFHHDDPDASQEENDRLNRFYNLQDEDKIKILKRTYKFNTSGDFSQDLQKDFGVDSFEALLVVMKEEAAHRERLVQILAKSNISVNNFNGTELSAYHHKGLQISEADLRDEFDKEIESYAKFLTENSSTLSEAQIEKIYDEFYNKNQKTLKIVDSDIATTTNALRVQSEEDKTKASTRVIGVAAQKSLASSIFRSLKGDPSIKGAKKIHDKDGDYHEFTEEDIVHFLFENERHATKGRKGRKGGRNKNTGSRIGIYKDGKLNEKWEALDAAIEAKASILGSSEEDSMRSAAIGDREFNHYLLENDYVPFKRILGGKNFLLWVHPDRADLYRGSGLAKGDKNYALQSIWSEVYPLDAAGEITSGLYDDIIERFSTDLKGEERKQRSNGLLNFILGTLISKKTEKVTEKKQKYQEKRKKPKLEKKVKKSVGDMNTEEIMYHTIATTALSGEGVNIKTFSNSDEKEFKKLKKKKKIKDDVAFFYDTQTETIYMVGDHALFDKQMVDRVSKLGEKYQTEESDAEKDKRIALLILHELDHAAIFKLLWKAGVKSNPVLIARSMFIDILSRKDFLRTDGFNESGLQTELHELLEGFGTATSGTATDDAGWIEVKKLYEKVNAKKISEGEYQRRLGEFWDKKAKNDPSKIIKYVAELSAYAKTDKSVKTELEKVKTTGKILKERGLKAWFFELITALGKLLFKNASYKVEEDNAFSEHNYYQLFVASTHPYYSKARRLPVEGVEEGINNQYFYLREIEHNEEVIPTASNTIPVTDIITLKGMLAMVGSIREFELKKLYELYEKKHKKKFKKTGLEGYKGLHNFLGTSKTPLLNELFNIKEDPNAEEGDPAKTLIDTGRAAINFEMLLEENFLEEGIYEDSHGDTQITDGSFLDIFVNSDYIIERISQNAEVSRITSHYRNEFSGSRFGSNLDTSDIITSAGLKHFFVQTLPNLQDNQMASHTMPQVLYHSKPLEQHFAINRDDMLKVFAYLSSNTNPRFHPDKELEKSLVQTMDMIYPLVDKLNLTIRHGAYHTTHGKTDGKTLEININTATKISRLEMSAQEVFVHELLHPILWKMKGTKEYRAMEEEYAYVRKHLRYEDFLEDFKDNANVADHALAKKMFNHAIHNKVDGVRTYTTWLNEEGKRENSNPVEEFAVFAATNQAMKKALARMDQRNPKPKVKGVYNTIVSMFKRLALIVGLEVSADNYGNRSKRITNLVSAYAGTLRKRAGILDRGAAKATKGYDAADDWFKRLAAKFDTQEIIRSIPKFWKHLKGQKYREQLRAFLGRWIVAKSQFIGEVASELYQSRFGFRDIVKLNTKSTVKIEQETQNLREFMIRNIEVNVPDITKEEQKSLYYNVFKTDLSALSSEDSQTTVTDIIELLTNKKKLNNKIEALRKEIGDLDGGANYRWYTRNAQDLAFNMVTGKRLYMGASLINVEQIVKKFGLPKEMRKEGKNLKSIKSLLERLVTLEAIRYNMDKNPLSGRFKGKPSELEFLIGQQAMIKEEALNSNFRGTEFNFRKGYIADETRDDLEVRIATETEGKKLEDMGFQQDREVNVDPSAQVAGESRYYYTRSNGDITPYLTGIVSLKGEKVKGTNLFPVHGVSPVEALRNKTMLKRMVESREKLAKHIYSDPAINYVKGKHQEMVAGASYNHEGKAIGYRHETSEEHKDEVMGREYNLASSLGTTYAGITRKVNSREMNQEAAEKMHEIYKEEHHLYPDEFKELTKESETYRLMPKDMKKNFERLYGDNPIMIRREQWITWFGYRKFSLRELEMVPLYNNDKQWGVLRAGLNNILFTMFQNKFFRGANDYYLGFVKWAKDSIVIRSGFVTTANIKSNLFLGWLKGIPLHQGMQDTFEAYTHMIQYQKDQDTLMTVEAQGKNPLLTDEQRKKNESEVNMLKHKMLDNPVSPLIEAGLYTTIVEDVNITKDKNVYRRKANDLFGEGIEKIPAVMRKATGESLMMHGSTTYEIMRNYAQISDFAARYSLHKHNMQKGKSFEDSIHDCMMTFINYDLAENRVFQAFNDYGLLGFTKYAKRHINVIAQVIGESPSRALALIASQAMFGIDVSDPTDSILGVSMDWMSRVFTPADWMGMGGDMLTNQAVGKLI